MKLKILFVEDSPHKQSRVTEYLLSICPDAEIDLAKSYASGCRRAQESNYDFVLMDLSLPTYDKEGSEAGGNFRPFGGREIAKKILRRGVDVKVIFITQYEAFSDKGKSYSFDDLSSELSSEYGKIFAGMIHFDSSKSAWKEQLKEALTEE